MTTGENRRRMEFIHTEACMTSIEKERRKVIVKKIVKMGVGISMAFMILSDVLIAYVSTRYMGYEGLYIALFGTLLNVTLGCLIAYHFGNKMREYYTKHI